MNPVEIAYVQNLNYQITGISNGMKFTDIKHKDRKELTQMLKDNRVKIGKFRFELSDKALKDFSQISKTKKDIARILTVLRANQ